MRGLRLSGSAVAMAALVAAAPPDDMAAKFGALEQATSLSLSTDGTKLVYIGPRKGKANAAYTVDLANPSQPRVATAADGDPLELEWCGWVSASRLVCSISALQRVDQRRNAATIGSTMLVQSSRVIAVDADGGNLKMLSDRPSSFAEYQAYSGGSVIDWLPQDGQAVLMQRWFVPEIKVVNTEREGLGVERIDVNSGKRSIVEAPRGPAVSYLTDGRGTVRVMGARDRSPDGYLRPATTYLYRIPGDQEWRKLSEADPYQRSGFTPMSVDADRNIVYGIEKRDGSQAIYAITLDEKRTRSPVFVQDGGEVYGIATMGPDRRFVGVATTDYSDGVRYVDPAIVVITSSLSKALPGQPRIQIEDSSLDGSKLLIWAGGDADPGSYYLFDRGTKKLQKIMAARPLLEGVTLAPVRTISYRAADGTAVPAYLTLPLGKTKNLPTIVMPHGGAGTRTAWNFDWLAQYYAARGYAVLQPRYRGSAGFGDGAQTYNGFKSWRLAIGDVTDAGRWLIAEGIADPAKLAIVGWSYGGYAALQSAVIAPDLFKAVVAIAPITDFKLTIEEHRGYGEFYSMKDYVSTPDARAASPLQNAATIKAPILLAQGEMTDGLRQSRQMADALRAAGKKAELIVYPGLTGELGTAEARTDLLSRSDAFLRASMGL